MPVYTQTQVNRFWREFTLPLIVMRHIEFFIAMCEQERCWIVDEGDTTSATPQIAAMTLSAGVNHWLNTSLIGRLYVRNALNGGGPNVDMKFFKAAGGGGGDEVFRITNKAPSSTSDLVAQNSSLIEGKVTLGATVIGESNDRHTLLVIQSFKSRARNVWPANSGIATDSDNLTKFYALCDDTAKALREIQKLWASFVGNFFTLSDTARGAAFLGERANELVLDDGRRVDDAGTINRLRGGVLELLTTLMANNTPTAQSVVKLEPTASAVAAGPNNVGKLNVTVTVGQRCPAIAVALRASRGVAELALGAEQLLASITSVVEGSGEPPVENGLNLPITIGRLWKGPHDITVLATRYLTKVNDNLHHKLADVAGAVIENESSDNSDNGDYTVEITENEVDPTKFDLTFYKTASMARAVAVAEGLDADEVFIALPIARGDPTINWTLGSAPADGDVATLKCNGVRVDNGNGKDTWTFTVARPAGGKTMQAIVDFFGGRLATAALGAETLSDDYVRQGSLIEVLPDVAS